MNQIGPVDSNHGDLYNEICALVFRSLRSIPCLGERHRGASGIGGRERE